MDIRARSISFATRPRRPDGPPDHKRAGETIFSISSFLLADLGRKADYGILCSSLACISGACLGDARFIVALLGQHGPGDPRQFVGEGRGQNVRMQARRVSTQVKYRSFWGRRVELVSLDDGARRYAPLASHAQPVLLAYEIAESGVVVAKD